MCAKVQGRPASAWRLRAVAIVVQAMLAVPAWSQAQAPASADAAPTEAARRAAMSPFRMILQNADVVRPKPPPAPVKKAAHAAAAERPAAAPAVAPTASASATRPAETAKAAAPAPEPQAERVSVAAPTAQAAREPAPPAELVPLAQDPPQLSAALRREQPQGTVKIAFAVKPDGTTGDVHVLASTDRRLNSASVTAVNGWRFRPIAEARTMEVELVYRNE